MTEFFSTSDAVAAFGRYQATVKTGIRIDTPVAHYFKFRDGKVSRYVNFINSAAFVEAKRPVTAGVRSQPAVKDCGSPHLRYGWNRRAWGGGYYSGSFRATRTSDHLPSLARSSRHKVTSVLQPGCGRRAERRRHIIASAVKGADTFIQLVGVSHPSPTKAGEFLEIDLQAARESIRAAREASVSHFIYVSVAHPAPVMKAYISVRMRCEQAIAESRLNATILRPWYVLGPGHLWPYALIPFYKLAELIPSTRQSAVRLGLVTIREMIGALLCAAENPVTGRRVWEPRDIRDFQAIGDRRAYQ